MFLDGLFAVLNWKYVVCGIPKFFGINSAIGFLRPKVEKTELH